MAKTTDTQGCLPVGSEEWLAVLDTLLCLLVIFPLCVLHWRGTWDLLDYFVLPENEVASNWITLVFGGLFCVFCTMIQTWLYSKLTAERRCLYVVVTRTFLYLDGWAILGFWRGTWDLLDIYFGEGWENAVWTYCIATGLCVVFRVVRTGAGMPAGITVDVEEQLSIPDSRFRTTPEKTVKSCCRNFWDVVFTQFVVVTLGIIIWRGIWNILDAFLLPAHPLASDLVSLGLGYLILTYLFILQYPFSVMSAKLDNRPIAYKIAFEDAVMIVTTWGVLLVWRGAWDLIKAYVIPDLLVGGCVCHVIGSLGLLALQGLSNVGTNNIDMDGDYDNGEGIFTTRYLRVLFQHKIDRKQGYGDGDPGKTSLLDECDSDDCVELDIVSEKSNGNVKINKSLQNGNMVSDANHKNC